MAIIEGQIIKTKWVGANRKQLESRGYTYTKLYDEIEIKVEDLSEKSHIKIEIICDWCNNKKMKRRTDINLDGHHFCNAKCLGKWLSKSEEGQKLAENRKTSIKTNCKLCDKELEKKASEFKGHGEHYCSRSCVAKGNLLEHNPNPSKEKIKVHCDNCNDSFEVKESISKKNKWHFCSRYCYSQFRSKNIKGENIYNFQGVTTSCLICNKEYKSSKWHLENNKDKFCSQDCYYKYRSIHYSGENHPQFGTTKTPEQIERLRIATASRIANGEFPQTNTSIHIKVKNSLKSINLDFQEEVQFKYYVLDFYNEQSNLAIEIMGDFWHASPIKYSNYEYLHDIQKNGVRRDKSKKTYLKKYHNIDILYLWEKDINENPDLYERLISLYCKENKLIDYNSFNYSLIDNEIVLNNQIIMPYFMKANTPLQVN